MITRLVENRLFLRSQELIIQFKLKLWLIWFVLTELMLLSNLLSSDRRYKLDTLR